MYLPSSMSVIVRTEQEDSPSGPTWWCAGFDGRLDIRGASFGRHGQCHLLFLMFSQGSLYGLTMDICTDRNQNTLYVGNGSFGSDSE